MTQVTWVQHGTGVRSVGPIYGYTMYTDILNKYISYTFQLLTSKIKLKPRSLCPGVCPGAPRQFAASRPGRIGKEFECVHIFPAVLRTRPGLGQKLITV